MTGVEGVESRIVAAIQPAGAAGRAVGAAARRSLADRPVSRRCRCRGHRPGTGPRERTGRGEGGRTARPPPRDGNGRDRGISLHLRSASPSDVPVRRPRSAKSAEKAWGVPFPAPGRSRGKEGCWASVKGRKIRKGPKAIRWELAGFGRKRDVANQKSPPGTRRTREHIIVSQSYNYVEKFFIDQGHTVDRPTTDYGIDLLVNTFDEDGYAEAGDILIQLKANDRFRFSKDGQ